MRFLGNITGRHVFLCTVEEYKKQINRLNSYFIIEDDDYKVIGDKFIVGIYDFCKNRISWFKDSQTCIYEPIRQQEESHVLINVAEREEDYFAQFTAPVDSFFAGLLKSEN